MAADTRTTSGVAISNKMANKAVKLAENI